MIFQERNRTDGIYWSQLELDAPDLLKLKDRVKKTINRQVYRVAVAFEKRVVPSISDQDKLFSLKFDVSKSLPVEPEASTKEIEINKGEKAIEDPCKKRKSTPDDHTASVSTRDFKRKR
jgi:hypothetical protein